MPYPLADRDLLRDFVPPDWAAIRHLDKIRKKMELDLKNPWRCPERMMKAPAQSTDPALALKKSKKKGGVA